MKKLYEEYKKAVEAANKADQAWEADPENAEKEVAFDEAYKAEYKAMEAIADEIVKISAGKIDKKTACAIIIKKGAELETLIARMA